MAKPASGPARHVATETWLPQGEQAAYLRSLSHVGQPVSLPSGASLFSQGQVENVFYVVVTGKVHVHMLSEDGHESILNIMGPGSVIGEAAAFLGQPRYSSARAIEDTSLLRFETGRIPALVRQDPDFALALIYLLSVKQRQMVARLRQAIFDPPEQRVIRFFDQFRQTHQDACGPQAPITVNLTHEQIGSLVDLSRVTVTRVLNRLKREGLLDLDGKKIMLAEGFSERIRGEAP
ncbi:CRP-like cAMP-activated global transcriptional regulator [Achromobacter veterisilvae]|uniref:CRP-like cAMP-activated global transcriptional regulator n=1 Tax=Achromobacter veterisilvae TaxID=2069367 RepID=A0A446CEF7_9BURK|nr:Crp/Fnr family transcriptional regulator [Achromobacter veterisilvae]SSW66215.1 CRP-like cAMP-activated global transcriptional regulator [Achromobacter veterisilvae]